MRSDLTTYGIIGMLHQNQNQPKRVIMSCHFPNSCQLESAKYIQNIFLLHIYLQNSHQKWHYADRNFIQSSINIGDDCYTHIEMMVTDYMILVTNIPEFSLTQELCHQHGSMLSKIFP